MFSANILTHPYIRNIYEADGFMKSSIFTLENSLVPVPSTHSIGVTDMRYRIILSSYM